MTRRALTKAQTAHVIDCVAERGRARERAQGKSFSDVDFAMGAAAVFFALGLQEHIPAAWIFNPLCGAPIFGETPPAPTGASDDGDEPETDERADDDPGEYQQVFDPPDDII